MKKGGKLKLKNVVEGIQGAAFMAFALVTPFLRPWRARWGATDAEVKKKLPGDELMPHPKWGYTHAVTIKTPVAEVWPWIVQMGQGRGGFYSYEFLENLVGCNIHNVDRIIAEFQHLKVGDSIRFHPKIPAYTVVLVEPRSALGLNARSDTKTGKTFELTDKMPEKYINSSWAWFLDERNDGTTRLFSRGRGDYRGLANALGFGPCFTEPISFVMDRKMLLGIKQRAESAREV
jgi:hypothetical protein